MSEYYGGEKPPLLFRVIEGCVMNLIVVIAVVTLLWMALTQGCEKVFGP